LLRARLVRQAAAALVAAAAFSFGPAAAQSIVRPDAQDLAREAQKDRETLATLDFGEAVRIRQANGHAFLALWLAAERPRGVALIAHGRGWSPNHDLYNDLRVRLADAGWSTLAIQLPVLDPSASKLGDYLWTYPDAVERFRLAVDWAKAKSPGPLAIVSHSLGATMANQYLIRTDDGKVGAWVFLSIINGLEDMFRLRIPVLDVYGEQDWSVTMFGAEERRAQIARVPGSRQVMLAGAPHFYDGQRELLARTVVEFLDATAKR
jgi:pimeloyl-ACP methyl ester carboxylesterase